jgi:hypothetical protein
MSHRKIPVTLLKQPVGDRVLQVSTFCGLLDRAGESGKLIFYALTGNSSRKKVHKPGYLFLSH